jgi:glycosyltransferase involved in cell wall biosynthesis
MKILQVVSSFAPAYAYGGPARSTYKISKSLTQLGHNVTVYTTDAYDADERFNDEKHGIPMEELNVHRFRNVNNTLAYEYNLCLAPGMTTKLKRNIKNFDIVHIEEFRTPQAEFARRYATKAGIPYILQTRGAVPRTLRPKQKWLFDKISGEKLFEDASRIIATSESESNRYFDVFPDTDPNKLEHIQNGVDLEIYQDPPRKGGFRTRYGIDPDVPVVLFVGRLDDMKGVDLLIDAFKEVRKQIPTAELFLVGPDDGLQNTLERQVSTLDLEEFIHFIGPLYNKSKLEAYVDADLFVLPSKYRYESFGNVVIEAMACETAVVLTEKCGAAEWIPSDAGRTIAAKPDGISEGIIQILNDDDLRAEMASNGRDLVLKKFYWSAVAEEIEEIYCEVINKEHP